MPYSMTSSLKKYVHVLVILKTEYTVPLYVATKTMLVVGNRILVAYSKSFGTG